MLLVAGAVYILFRFALSQPFAIEHISAFLSEKTGCRVTISGADVSGGTLILEGIELWNPEGFTRTRLLSINSLSLSPGWIGLIEGKTSLASLKIKGIRIRPEKNGNGQWNWAEVARRLMRKKEKPAREVSIARLGINDFSLIVNDRPLPPLSINVRNFSTRGSTESSLAVSATDPSGNPIRLAAQGRMGQTPSFRVILEAPRMSLAALNLSGNRNLPVALDQAEAGIRIAAELRNSLTTARVTVSADKIGLRTGGGVIPLKGSLDIPARYDGRKDETRIDAGSVSFNSLPPVRFSGKVTGVRNDAAFELVVPRASLPLEKFSSFFPEKLRKTASLAGMLSTSDVTIAGNRKSGITSGRIVLSLRDGSIAENGRMLLEKVGIDLAMQRGSGGWLVNGRLFSAPESGHAAIQSIEAPFSAGLSPRLKPLRVAFPAIAARVAGASLEGRLSYAHGAAAPWNLSLSTGAINLAALNSYLAKTSLTFDAGSASLAAKASGSSPRQFEADLSATGDSLSFAVSGRRVSVGNAAVSSRIHGSRHGILAAGDMKLSAAVADGGKWGLNADYAVGNGRLELRNAALHSDKTSFRLSRATMVLPPLRKHDKSAGIPLTGTFNGLEARHAPLSAAGISGSVACRYTGASSDRQLRGSADMSIASLSVRDRRAASLSARLTFSGTNAIARLQGTSLGGTVEGTVQAQPFSGDRALSFLVRFREQRLAELADLLPPSRAVRLAGGVLDADLVGAVAGKSGLKAKLTASGRELALRNAGNREIVSGMGLRLLAAVDGGDLTLQEAAVSRGQDVTARFSGSVKRYASNDRQGKIDCTLPAVALNSVIDAFANVLPRALQEAECRGSLAMTGSATLDGKRVETSGELTIGNASIDLPSQKASITDIEGRLPFSFVIPGPGHDRQAPAVSYSRENYQRLLAAARNSTAKGAPFRIGSVRFGALQTGKIEAVVNAGRGMMEISAMNAALYGGILMGNGFLRYDNGLECEANLLLNNLSLEQFCASFPQIRGYITGRVDGVMSLYQGNNNVRGLNGFANLWTREGNGEKMLVSKEFLQKLAGKKLRGFFFTNDRRYDNGEISAFLRDGFLTFEKLDISHRNLLGMKDLSVTVVPVQNRISLDHLLESIREAAARGKGGGGEETKTPVQTDLKWLE